jgi:hypothetical protein
MKAFINAEKGFSGKSAEADEVEVRRRTVAGSCRTS